jgi:hypothetical protein
MDRCPKCKELSLVFDPYTKKAKCLRLECGYREVIDRATYAYKFRYQIKDSEQLPLFESDNIGAVRQI